MLELDSFCCVPCQQEELWAVKRYDADETTEHWWSQRICELSFNDVMGQNSQNLGMRQHISAKVEDCS